METRPKPLIEPWLRRTLQALVAVGFGLVALNFGLRWWFWEVEAGALHLAVSAADLWNGRMVLCFAAATLAGGFAICDLLGSLPGVTRRSRWCLVLAAVLAAIPLAAGAGS